MEKLERWNGLISASTGCKSNYHVLNYGIDSCVYTACLKKKVQVLTLLTFNI